MLKRVSEALGKEISYVKELHTKYFVFDDIQYLLKDEDNKEYLLVLCFDDEPRQPGEIWSNKVDKLMYRLYSFPLSKLKKVKNKRIKYNIICEDIEKSDYRDEFSLNRFEIIYPNNRNYVLRYNNEALMLTIDKDNKAFVGTWNNFIKKTTFLAMINYIFKHFRKVNEIEYKNLIYDTGFDSKRWRHPDYYIPLPKTIEELCSRLSSKGKHNIKREKRIIEESFGPLELVDNEYNHVGSDLISLFYKYKNETHDLGDYDITKTNLTNIYTLTCGNVARGIVLSCEQGDIVFIENHTFDSLFKKYSFGKVMYDMYLKTLIDKHKKGLSLAGGNLDYKKRYGSICFNSYSGSLQKRMTRDYSIMYLLKYPVSNRCYNKFKLIKKLVFRN